VLRKFSIYIFILFVISTTSYAQQAVDLTNFIAQPTFPTHTLSTGEVVEYRSEGSGDGTPVRQMKNNNYEQFFLKSDGIYRREDTSWAPFGGAQAVCENGNKAAYTLDSSATCVGAGQTPLTDGARWLPYNVEVGQVYPQQTHNILSFDTKVPAGANEGYNINTKEDMTVCTLRAPQTGYPACSQTPSLKITGYFEPDTFTFCTGAKNTAPMVTISGDTGAGSGDGFAYMEGCGLVGFSDGNMRVGIKDGCGVTAAPESEWECTSSISNPDVPDEYSCDDIPDDEPILKTIKVQGRVSQATWTDVLNPDGSGEKVMKTGLNFRNFVVTNYTGDPCTVSKFGGRDSGGNLVNIDYKRSPHVTTDSAGYYSLDVHQTEKVKDRFISYSCNGNIVDLYKCDLTKDTDGVINLDVEANCQGTYTTVDKTGAPVRPFLELNPISPGEDIALSDLNRFTICAEAPVGHDQVMSSQPDTKISIDDYVMDEHEVVKHDVVKYDVDYFFVDEVTSPDVDCDPNNIPPPYTKCMPPEARQALRDEFNVVNPETSLARPACDALANESNLICGNILQNACNLRFEQDQDKTSPHSDIHTQILPSLTHVAALNSHLQVSEKDRLGKSFTTSLDRLDKLVYNPAKFKEQLPYLDPDMCFAYNKDGECVYLGEVKVPNMGDKTLYEIKGRAGTGRTYDAKYFPGACVREIPYVISKMGPDIRYTHNVNDTADTTIAGNCSNSKDCARDTGINEVLDGKNTTPLKAYAEQSMNLKPATDLTEMRNVLAYGNQDQERSSKTGYAAMLTMPGDQRFETYDTGAGISPKEVYKVEGDNECKKIGFPVFNYCMCAESQFRSAKYCPNPLNNADVPNSGEYDQIKTSLTSQYTGGSVALSEGIPDEYLDEPHSLWGSITSMVYRLVSGIGFSNFDGHVGNNGGACVVFEWSDVQHPGYCPGYGANASDMVVPCSIPGHPYKNECACENYCKVDDGTTDGAPCSEEQRKTCTGVGVSCYHLLQDVPPDEYAENDNPDPACIGDARDDLKVVSNTAQAFNSPVAYTSRALSIPGEKVNSCEFGGTAAVVKAAYEEIDKTSYNDAVDTDFGQYVGCIAAQKLYKVSDPPYSGKVIPGDNVSGSLPAPPPTDMQCNAFNIMGPDGLLNIGFEESLERALNTLNRDVAIDGDGDGKVDTSVLVNRYGPWCQTEAFPGHPSPFGYNLTKFIDDYAVSGAGRQASCENDSDRPPRTPRPEDVGVACSAFSVHSDPGDPYFDYYRGALNGDRCPLLTNRWPSGVSEQQVIDSVANANMPQGLISMGDSTSNPALYAIRQVQLPLVVAKARERNINPYLIIGIWGTESGWSNRPSCYNNATP
jgi:hypothetical protein